MVQLAIAVEPGVFVMTDAVLAGGQLASDEDFIKINSNAKFGAVRCEVLNMGYYSNGDAPPAPVSPVDDSDIYGDELVMLPVFATNSPLASGFIPGQVNFPNLAPFNHGRPLVVPYEHWFDQANGKDVDSIYAFDTTNVNSQVYPWGASLILAISQRLGIFIQTLPGGAFSAGQGGGGVGTGGGTSGPPGGPGVTGTGGAFTAGEDLAGTSTMQEVIGIQGHLIDGGPINGDVLVYSSVTGKWEPTPFGTGGIVDVVEIPLAPTAPGNFTVPHGLGVTPAVVLIQTTSGGDIWFQTPLRYDATNLYLDASAGGVTGVAQCWMAAPTTELPLSPSAPGNFSVPHGLSGVPAMVLLQMTSGGVIWGQPTIADATNVNLVASSGGVTGNAEVWLYAPVVVVISHRVISLAPSAPGNFSIAHGLGHTPTFASLQMTSGGRIWFQTTRYDSTNLLLTASAGGITGYCEVWG